MSDTIQAELIALIEPQRFCTHFLLLSSDTAVCSALTKPVFCLRIASILLTPVCNSVETTIIRLPSYTVSLE